MADTPSGDRTSIRPNLRPSTRAESLAALLDRPIEDEAKVLEALVTGLASGETTLELFGRFHDAAMAQERVANLSFAYERVAKEPRIRMLAKPKQAEFFLSASRFFGDVFGDLDAGIGYAERAREVAPDDPQVFDQLETLLASSQQGTKLAKLYVDTAARAKNRADKLRLYRAAIELLESFGGASDEVAQVYRHIVDIDPEDRSALEILEKLYLGSRRFRELADLLERSLPPAGAEPGSTNGAAVPDPGADDCRLRLVGLYRGELRDPAKAAPHVEALLSRDPVSAAALQAAEALVDHRPVAPRIAPLLSAAYRRLGRIEDEASTLALELKFARPPRLSEVHRRLAILRQDVLGDPSGALELLEPLVARDPGDDDLRRRYLEVSATFHREIEAVRLLARAIAVTKDADARARVSLEIADVYASHGDAKRARAALEPLIDEVPEGPDRVDIARRLVDLHADGADPKGLASALVTVVTLDTDLPSRIAAAKRLVDLCDGPIDEPRTAIVAWRALLSSPRVDEALDRLEALYTKTGDDAGIVDVLLTRAKHAKDPEQARAFAFRAAELRASKGGDRARAIEAFRELVATYGPTREALARLATLLEQNRSFGELVSVLEVAIEHASVSERAPMFARVARVRLAELRDAKGALEALRSALDLDPREPTARRLAERLMSEGDHRLAAALVLEPRYRAEHNASGLVRVLELRAELAAEPHRRLRDLEEAFELCEGELNDPRKALELSGAALGVAASGLWALVPPWLERFRRASAHVGDPSRRAGLLANVVKFLSIERAESAELAREAAEALFMAGEVQRALELYRQLLAFDPASAELLRRVDELLAQQGSPGERLSLYLSALERAVDAARRRELLHAIARIERRDLGDLPAAAKTLRTLAGEAPSDPDVHEALVDVYTELGDRDALAAELARALPFTPPERRAAVLLDLSRVERERGQEARALELFRELVQSDSLPYEAFDEVEALARAASDGALLREVLERRVARSTDDRDQAESSTRLGDHYANLGEPASALDAWRRAARLFREARDAGEPDKAKAQALYERIFRADRSDREAARFLVQSYAESGQFAKAPDAFPALLEGDSASQAIELLLSLAGAAIAASAVEEIVRMAELALDALASGSAGPATRWTRELTALKARAFGSLPGRREEAAAMFRALVEAHGDDADVAAFRAFLDAGGDDAVLREHERWLFSFRAQRASNPAAVLSEWAIAEETRFGDTGAAIRVYEELLGRDPTHAAARESLYRLESERDPSALLGTLSSLVGAVPPEDATDIELQIASLLVERMDRAPEGLAILQTVLERSPAHAEALRIGRVALRRPRSRVQAAELVGRAATSLPGTAGEALLFTLLDETEASPELASARAEWYTRLVDLLSPDPARALRVAAAAAREMPEVTSLWDGAERLARRAGDPRIVAEAYRAVLESPIDSALGEVIGRRLVEFQEEWFDEPNVVLGLLERVLAVSPRARWALDRVKLAYNADARWSDLFALYDRAIEGATDPRDREDLLDEAALAAKDLANDSARAIGYLERLQALRPEARVESMLERLYDRTGRAKELLALLEKRRGAVSGPDRVRLEARLARLRLDLGDLAEAFQLVQGVIAADPEEAVAYTLLERLVRTPASLPPPPSEAPDAPRGPKGKKQKKRPPGVDVRREAVAVLEATRRRTGDKRGLAFALEAALELAATDAERVRRREELVTLHLDDLDDPKVAFSHVSALLAAAPRAAEYRAHLDRIAARTGAPEERAEVFVRAADAVPDESVKVELLREAAALLERAELLEKSVSVYQRVLALSEREISTTLEVAALLSPLLSRMGRHGEQCDVLERVSVVETDAGRRREARLAVARVAFEELADVERAVRALRVCIEDDPADLDALEALDRVLASAARYEELVLVLKLRVRAGSRGNVRSDEVRIARLLADEIGDRPAAVEAWRAIEREFGANDETYAALFALLEAEARWVELAELVERAAEQASEPGLAGELFRSLGDLHRDRTGEPVKALHAYCRVGDFARAITVADHLPDRSWSLTVAETLLELSVNAWREVREETPEDAEQAIAEAAHWAVSTLARRYLESGAFEKVVETELRGASLPFDEVRRRKLRRDAAWTCCDRLEDPERAIRILDELFAEDPADEIALASVTRFARLLDESRRYAELAALWEQQARCRAEVADRTSAAALWARAAGIWENELADVERAIAVHREGAALGGEASLEALARIHLSRRSYRAAAEALEFLSAQSTREEVPGRVLLLADAYLALGEWEFARARLEHAAATAIDAGAVRRRLLELYRVHREFGALCDLLVAEAARAPDDRARLELLREAARLHTAERGDPASAVPLLERAIEIDPEDASLHLSLSDALRASGRYDEAAAVLRSQIARYGYRRPKDRAIVHLSLARVALAAGNRAEALAELDTGSKINPTHPGILHELARLSLEEGHLERAERTFRALLLVLRKPDGDATDVPGRAEIYLDLSEIAARVGEPERAAELVESAFEAALDSPVDAVSLEQALRKAGRYDLLTRAIESRLAGAVDPAVAARALSDLVLLNAERQTTESSQWSGRVQGEAARIRRHLEAQRTADAAAWAAMTQVYGWLGDTEAETAALERRVDALLASSAAIADSEPLLRLAAIWLANPAKRDDGVRLVEHALDAGADLERAWQLLRAAQAGGPPHRGVLRVLERIAREPGRESSLVEVLAASANAGPLSSQVLREGVFLATSSGAAASLDALLRGAISHADVYPPADVAFVKEQLARTLLVTPAGVEEAARLLEEAAAVATDAVERRALVLEAARLAAGPLGDPERAARLYGDVLERTPADRDAWEPLLDVYRGLGATARLVELIRRTLPFVDSVTLRSRLRFEEANLTLRDEGGTDAAIALLERVMDEDPGMQPAADLLAQLLEQQGRLGELVVLASAQLDVAKLTGDARAVEALSLKLGAFLERNGERERARFAYEGILASNASSRDALRAIVRLGDASQEPATSAGLADAMERLLPLEEPDRAGPLAARLVEVRRAEGDAAGVERALVLACAALPADASFRDQLVQIYLDRGDSRSAADVVFHASELDPNDFVLIVRAVELYERAGALEQAVAGLGIAIARSAGDPDLYVERARLHTALSNPEAALEDIEIAHAVGGGRTADLAQALAFAIERSEGEKQAGYALRLVDLLESAGEVNQARERLTELLRYQPKHTEALRKLASLAAAEARWDEAAATYRRLISLESGEARVAAALNLADACEHSGRLADARGGLERALEASPGSTELRARLRQLYESTGATRELVRLLLQEGREPGDVPARMAAMVSAAELLLEREDDAAEAALVLEEARRISPESIRSAVLLARAYAALDRPEQAMVALDEVVAAHRGRRTRELSLVHREISNIHLESGNLNAALEALAKAFDLDLRNGELAMQLGYLALEIDESEMAAKAFRSVTMMKLKSPGLNEGTSTESKAVAYYHLSRIAQAQGDVRKARLMASKAVSENPEHADAQALLRELRIG